MRPRPLLPLALLTLAAAPAAAQGTLLERARAALGTGETSAQLEGRGKTHHAGVDGSLRVVLAAGGAFRTDLESVLPESTGFDGTTVWMRDRSGLERKLELEEADREKLSSWVLSGHWCAAREVKTTELERQPDEPPRLALALDGTPMTMTLTPDATTWLPAELAYLDDSGSVTWKYSDYREVAGRRLAHRWTFEEGGQADRFEIENWKAVPVDASVLRATLARPRDVSFHPEGDPELDVVRVGTGHLLVEPALEGEQVGMFIFDTGAGAMTIDPAVADELGLPEIGQVLAVGVGGHTTASYRRGTLFELGPLALEDPVYIELDLAFLTPIFGRKVAGIVGYDVLARCVAEIETRTPYIALHDPARYRLAQGAWQELVVLENTPGVRARFAGEHEGLFRLDTGANGTVSFHASAVRELALLEGRALTDSASGGVGGQSAAKTGRLEWFELGGHRFENKTVQFSLAERGAFSDRYTTGNIGQDFLSPFRVVLDYPDHRIAFVPLED